jgi:uncharacterized protein
MSYPRLFTACVPVLIRYLGTLDRILVAVEKLPQEQQTIVLGSRLAPDMLPFSNQVETAAYFSLRTAYPLAGRPVPVFTKSDTTIPALRATTRVALNLLQALSPTDFVNAEERTVRERAGTASVELSAEQFLYEFALPNFFFHLNMAYGLARMHGCVLGKAEYDGFHVYGGEA